MRLEDVFEPVEPLLEFSTIACSQSWLLPLSVLAVGAIASAPATRWLPSVTFDLFIVSYRILKTLTLLPLMTTWQFHDQVQVDVKEAADEESQASNTWRASRLKQLQLQHSRWQAVRSKTEKSVSSVKHA